MDISNLSNFTQEQIRKNVEFDKLRREIENDLKTNQKYKDYFDQYSAYSIEHFIDHYSFQKALWITYGETYEKIVEDCFLKYLNIAEERLWDIQHKKLFNLQCEWRAELIKIPEIEISYEFEYWDADITRCPFLPPITEEEFNLYRAFVLTDGFNEDPSWEQGDWQDYDTYRNEHNNRGDGILYPEWYFFYDSRMGTSSLLALPDIRGEKEDFYIDLMVKKRKEENPEKYEYKPPSDQRPYLHFYDTETVDLFVDTFEDGKVKEYYRLMKRGANKGAEEDDDLIEDIEILQRAGNIELTHGKNWRESIELTVKNYEKQQIYNAFETAFNNYLSRIKMGIAFERKHKLDTVIYICEYYRKEILEGRILNNETADFDF